MARTNHNHLQLGPLERVLLLHNVPNELINGFKLQSFEATIGVPKDSFGVLARRLQEIPKQSEVIIKRHETAIFRNALSAVLEQLGEAEFQTRTGYDFEAGQVLLRELSRLSPEDHIKIAGRS